MPFERPRIEIFQEFKNAAVTPATQEFDVCLIGPCYDIYDYKNDKDKLAIGEYVSPGKTKDAPCDSNGISTGRPDAGVPFMTLAEPPQFRAGAVLDPKSVNLYFDKVLIDLAHGTAAVYSENNGYPTVTINDTGVDLSIVKAGDRIVLNKTGDTEVFVKTVKSVNGNQITLTSYINGTISGKWRIEHELSDVEIDQNVLTVNDNSIVITVPTTGIVAAYEKNIYVVNYAEMYLEYRALRTDLQKLIQINTIDEIPSILGLLDERNPLAVGAYVALSNAGTPIFVYGVNSDSLSGHTAARDFLSSNKTIYAIVPLTDSLSTSDWLSVINMWKQDCEKQALPERSRFRIVIGSLSELPQYKNSVDPSTTGSTLAETGAAADVFVTSTNSPEFTSDVNSNTLLDIMRPLGGWGTYSFSQNIFDSDYSGAKVIKGVIGGHRLRTTTALSDTPGSQTTDYIIRRAILASEGGTTILKNVTNVSAETDNDKLKLTHSSFNANTISVGDIVQIVSAGTSGASETAYYIEAVGNGYITTNASYGGGGSGLTVNIYRLPSIANVTVSSSKALTFSGTFPTGYGVGDIIILLSKTALELSYNKGMYKIESINGNIITLDTAFNLNPESGSNCSAVVIHPINADGNTTVTARPRLSLLRDDHAQFLSTVAAGEYIEIPYPANQPGLIFDTTKNRWPIAEVVNDQLLRAQLGDLEELAPKNLTAGFNGDCPYRIAIGLDKANQVKELSSITNTYKSMRLVMCWPHAVKVSGVYNNKTGEQNYLSGQYLACAVAGQVAANPPQQGFTYMPISAVTELYGSNFYFTDDQLTELRNNGWYVFVQDNETSSPYSIHEVTTDVSAYEFGELMHVKDFDYVSIQLKNVLEAFKGRYNITPNTIEIIKSSLMAQVEYLKNRRLSKLGAPLLDAVLGLITQSEADRLEIYMELRLPHVLNRVGLHLVI